MDSSKRVGERDSLEKSEAKTQYYFYMDNFIVPSCNLTLIPSFREIKGFAPGL